MPLSLSEDVLLSLVRAHGPQPLELGGRRSLWLLRAAWTSRGLTCARTYRHNHNIFSHRTTTAKLELRRPRYL